MASYHVEIRSGKKGSAARHAAYIAREGQFGKKEDLLDTGYGNMPKEAEGNPKVFWNASDKCERANGAAYREWIVALPNELSLEQNRALVRKIVDALVGNKPYQHAIHRNVASLGEDANTHAHVMFSDRQPDEHDRPLDEMFARYNPVDPARGGRRKDSGGKTPLEIRMELTAKRKLVADLQNEILAAVGSSMRVDHRSLKERGIQREPERHLGQVAIKRMTAEQRAEYVTGRLSEPAG